MATDRLWCNMSTNKPTGSAQFTPGPWEVNKSDTCLIMVSKPIGLGVEKHIADVQYNEERYANATLIAAAPAMYEALQATLAYFLRSKQSHAPEVRAIRTALAQAEGSNHARLLFSHYRT